LSHANSSTHAELFSIDMLSASALGLRMVAAANLVEVAALVGDTTRATMLNALMGGQSLTATELAYCANVSRSTASDHLSKLVAARLLTVTRNRRFSYYRIASPLVATMLESIKVVAAIEVPPRHLPRSANDDAIRFARSCYDHLAGQLGVAVTDALVAMGHIVLTDEGGEVTSSGERFLSAFGADLRPRTRLPALPRLERASLSHQGTCRSSDTRSSIGARMAQMCVGQPCTPANVVWTGGFVRNLPDRDQQ
jgi:DNA-binding transcriptional ArsR family regulator